MEYLAFPVSTPVSFISCGNFVYEGEWTHSERVIDTFELIVGVEGEIFMEQDGESFVVRPGDSLLLLPNRRHRGYAPSVGSISFHWMHFKLEGSQVLNEAAGRRRLGNIGNNPYSSMSKQVVLPIFHEGRPDSKLGILFHQLLHLRSEPPYTTLAVDYSTTNILIQLTQNILDERRKLGKRDINSSAFEKSLEWIRDNCTSSLSTKDIASRYRFNPSYYSKLFHARTGMRLLEYVNTLRISRAKMLLYESDLEVKEIAREVGFADERYFMRVFKEVEDISPTQFRKAFYKTHQNRS